MNTTGNASATQNSDNNSVDNPGDVLNLCSDFVTFVPGSALSEQLNLTGGTLFNTLTSGSKALESFRAEANGQFTATPAPRGNDVPEPASWALMIVGMGLMGTTLRRRRTVAQV